LQYSPCHSNIAVDFIFEWRQKIKGKRARKVMMRLGRCYCSRKNPEVFEYRRANVDESAEKDGITLSDKVPDLNDQPMRKATGGFSGYAALAMEDEGMMEDQEEDFGGLMVSLGLSSWLHFTLTATI
jgi:translation initiation factor 5B